MAHWWAPIREGRPRVRKGQRKSLLLHCLGKRPRAGKHDGSSSFSTKPSGSTGVSVSKSRWCRRRFCLPLSPCSCCCNSQPCWCPSSSHLLLWHLRTSAYWRQGEWCCTFSWPSAFSCLPVFLDDDVCQAVRPLQRLTSLLTCSPPSMLVPHVGYALLFLHLSCFKHLCRVLTTYRSHLSHPWLPPPFCSCALCSAIPPELLPLPSLSGSQPAPVRLPEALPGSKEGPRSNEAAADRAGGSSCAADVREWSGGCGGGGGRCAAPVVGSEWSVRARMAAQGREAFDALMPR